MLGSSTCPTRGGRRYIHFIVYKLTVHTQLLNCVVASLLDESSVYYNFHAVADTTLSGWYNISYPRERGPTMECQPTCIPILAQFPAKV